MDVPHLTAADYVRAEQMLGHNRTRMLAGACVRPVWLKDSDRFFYRRTADRFVLVDPDAGTRTELDQPPDDGGAPPATMGELPSPDGKWVAFRREHNLWVRSCGSGEEFPLTTDGEEHYKYGGNIDVSGLRTMLGQLGVTLPPMAVWSPDSTRLLTHRTDERAVRDVVMVESSPADGGPPVVHRRKYPFIDDDGDTTAQYVVLDVRARTAVWEDAEPWHLGHLSPVAFRWVWWDTTGEAVYFLRQTYDARTLTLYRFDPTSGGTRVVVEESADTRVEPVQSLGERPVTRVLGNGEVLWYSQRDGWGHLYHYDADGALLGQVTNGGWAVRAVLHVDESRGVVYFLASGLVAADVYVRQLCRVNLDGTGFTRLTDDDLDHGVVTGGSGRFFVDTASTVSIAPVTVVRDTDGRTVVELERTETTALTAAGWTAPERFRVTAADGVTDIYGILWRPHGFDPQRSYPIVDNPYPGPQVQRAPAAFSYTFFTGQPEALAALGFAVVAIDGRGTPGRDKAFHDASYGNLGNGGYLEDHVAAIRQLAQRHPWLDTERVGIFGNSGGGFATARAMFTHPDFYRVGVSIAGDHDMRHYIPMWSLNYLGELTEENWASVDNARLAANLRGKLLLVHGELDDNVLPYQTLRVVNALIAADKDFDLLVVPGAEHVFLHGNHYVTRRTWDYFVRHLHGVEPPEYSLQPFPTDLDQLAELFG